MKGVVLDRSTLGKGVDLSSLSGQLDEYREYETTRPDQVDERISGFDIVLCNKVVITREHMEAHGSLKMIAVLATGTNNADLDAAKDLGVTVCNVSGYSTYSVAQHTMTCILALSNNLLAYTSDVSKGKWCESKIFCMIDYPIMELAGKNLVLVGYGNIGQKVAQMAEAFGMNVLIASIPGYEPKDVQVERSPLDELLKSADVLSVHCPLTTDTRHLIDEKAISLMKSSAFIINCSRGGIVDELAAAEALKDRRLGGAAFDVLTMEPPENVHPLIREEIPNLIVTPHCAWAGERARQTLINEMALNLEAFKKKEPRCVVS
ncbi:MAG: glycerate dehydrogenase [Chlamydiales bacterium]|jgi:glycerate dehydrogenase